MNGLVVKWYIIEHFVIHFIFYIVHQQHNTITIYTYTTYICNVPVPVRVLPSILRLLSFAMLWFGGLLRSVSLNKSQGVAHEHCTMAVSRTVDASSLSVVQIPNADGMRIERIKSSPSKMQTSSLEFAILIYIM